MLASILRFLIVVELTVYLVVALFVFDATPYGATVIVVACFFGLRLIINVLPFLFAWRFHSSVQRLKWGALVRMFIAEYAAFITNFVLVSPFERLWMGGDRLKPCAERPPLLLIHGYTCSRGSWWWLRRPLEAAGWTVATINLEPIYGNIDNYVEAVAQRIDDVLAETGAEQVIVVGHSMGGLVARAYLRRYGTAKIARIVTLGTPYGGSELARIGSGQNARQIRPGNAWLTDLFREAPWVDTLTIFSRHDNYVMPESNLELPGAQCLRIDGVGHLTMLYSSKVAAALLAGLQSGGGGRDKR